MIKHRLHTGLVGYRLKGTLRALDRKDGDSERLFSPDAIPVQLTSPEQALRVWLVSPDSRHPFRPETSLVNKTPRARMIPNAIWVGYHSERAVVVVEGAPLAIAVTGAITMIAVGILFNVVGLGVICWALFALAIHALPFFVGLTAGIYSFQAGMGPFGAIVIGFIVACCTLVVGRYAFSVAPGPVVRLVIGLLFAVPAARAGYDVSLALSHIGIGSEWWRESFAMLGALAVGNAAWSRTSMQAAATLRSSVALGLISHRMERRPQVG